MKKTFLLLATMLLILSCAERKQTSPRRYISGSTCYCKVPYTSLEKQESDDTQQHPVQYIVLVPMSDVDAAYEEGALQIQMPVKILN